MKHLKPYNESSTIDEVKSNILDILIELSDQHIPIHIYCNTSASPTEWNKYYICIHIGNRNSSSISRGSWIDLNKYKEDLLRLNDYLESEGYKFSSFGHLVSVTSIFSGNKKEFELMFSNPSRYFCLTYIEK